MIVVDERDLINPTCGVALITSRLGNGACSDRAPISSIIYRASIKCLTDDRPVILTLYFFTSSQILTGIDTVAGFDSPLTVVKHSIQPFPQQNQDRRRDHTASRYFQPARVSWCICTVVSISMRIQRGALRRHIVPCVRKSWLPGKFASWMHITYAARATGRL